MNASRSQRRPSRRSGAALAFALLLAGPAIIAPGGALAAAPGSTQRPPFGGGAGGPGSDPDDPGSLHSIHYAQALEHDGDVIDFAPGDRVAVAFQPRPTDRWLVDGHGPRALPAGHATGAEMRAAPQGAAWSAGRPSDTASPAAALLPPNRESDAGASAARLTSAVVDPSGAAVDPAPIGPDGLRREIFGFLPYWEVGAGSTVLDWQTLSTVAYFSVGCTSSGNLAKKNADGTSTTGWAGWTSSKMTSIITAAHQNQTRVVLTVSCFAWSSSGATTQANLLASATARSTLAKQIAAAVRDRGADGANLDFEPIVAGYADEFTALVRSIRAELNAVAPGYQLTFDTLGSIGNQPIAEATAPGGADAIFIMGYDYRLEGSSTAGSISPLTGPRYDLTDTINAYAAKVSPSKLILGVPYYGRAWSTSSDAPNATNISGAKYGASAAPLYEDAVDFAAQYGRRWDSIEQAPWTAYHKQTCTSTYGCVTSWRELYYDDATSLRLRYDLVNRSELRGAGIWALGYEGTRPELRAALADKFLADKTPPLTGITTLAEVQRDEGFRIAWTSYDDSPISGYDVQVSVDGGAWAAWLTSTTLSSAIYLGAQGHRYAFRIRATDSHGNVSAWDDSTTLTNLATPATIAIGGFVTVLADGLHMRSSASTGASAMATLAVGDSLKVTGGPASGDGYTWYQVEGPVRQWQPVDAIQRGGWVAASGNGTTNVEPRSPVTATNVDAGIRGLKLAGGDERAVTPNGDGVQDTLALTWTNGLAFDSMALRVYRTDGSFLGSVAAPATAVGPAAFAWDSRVGGSVVPDGAYVLQLQGLKGSTAYSAPSSAPVSAQQIGRFGVMVGSIAPTHVQSFKSTTASPTKATTLSYALIFGGPVSGLAAADFTRGGTATGCTVGPPSGSGASWTIALTGCSQGTVALNLKPASVWDVVGNVGPPVAIPANVMIVDRTAPKASAPRVSLRTGVSLPSASATSALPVTIALGAADAGGAGIAAYDVARSYDGRAFTMIAGSLAATSLSSTLIPGHSYRFEVRARDKAGNVGAWVAGPTIRGSLQQQSSTAVSWTGTWKVATNAAFSGGSDRYATVAGATAKYAFTGRGIAIVTSRAPGLGAMKVYVDGVFVAAVDMYAPTLGARFVAFSRGWSVSGFHTIRLIVVVSTSRPRVDLDAFEVIR